MLYRGLLPSRDWDIVGLGVAEARLNEAGDETETVVETFYKLQLTEEFSIQPDLQFIASPSGIYPDSLVCGLRIRWQPSWLGIGQP